MFFGKKLPWHQHQHLPAKPDLEHHRTRGTPARKTQSTVTKRYWDPSKGEFQTAIREKKKMLSEFIPLPEAGWKSGLRMLIALGIPDGAGGSLWVNLSWKEWARLFTHCSSSSICRRASCEVLLLSFWLILYFSIFYLPLRPLYAIISKDVVPKTKISFKVKVIMT